MDVHEGERYRGQQNGHGGGQNYPKPKIVHVFYGLARI